MSTGKDGGYKYMGLCMHMHTDIGYIAYIHSGLYIRLYRQNSNPFSRFGVTRRVSAHNSELLHICKDLMSDSLWL